MAEVQHKIIQISVDRSPEVEKLQSELETANQLLGIHAKEEYDQFRLDKDTLSMNMKEDKIFEDAEIDAFLEPITSPTELMRLKKLYIKQRLLIPEKDVGTNPSNPPQGSQVSLDSGYGSGKSMDEKEYGSYSQMIQDLYERKEKGDKQAEAALNKLWRKSEKQLRNIEKGRPKMNFEITKCPICNSAVVDGRCTSCGWEAK